MLQYLIVCPLVFLAGLVDSIAGGGELIALPAYVMAALFIRILSGRQIGVWAYEMEKIYTDHYHGGGGFDQQHV